jgi:hypothetical protein
LADEIVLKERSEKMMWNTPKLIFIHIPKTGGASIERFLIKSHMMYDPVGAMGQHEKLQKAYEIYGDSVYSYRMFTVKRNPLHRITSLYLYLTNNNNSGGKRLGMPHTGNPITFKEYYTFLLDSFRNKTLVTYAEDVFHYCTINGLVPDQLKVLDFDNLEENFISLWKHEWGLDMPINLPFINDNKNIPTNDPKRKYFLQDPDFIAAVEEIYEQEIKLFNFKIT